MRTSQSFSFISYNSHDYLKFVLNQLVEEGIFYRCACWFHNSTGDEKNHFHCYIEPCNVIDTSILSALFIEFFPDDSKQSIAVRPKCGSKWVDAYLYGIHDSVYLAYKRKERELVNIVSDKHIYIGDFKEDIKEAEFYRDKYCLSPYEKVADLFYRGFKLEEIFIKLRIPFGQMHAVKEVYKMLYRNKPLNVDLSGREIITPRLIDDEEKK